MAVAVTGLGGAAAWQAEAAAPPRSSASGTAAGLSLSGPPVLAALPAGAAVPTGAGLAAHLDQIVQGTPGTQIAAAVTDVATGQQIYGRSQTLPMPPASTVKLATAAAALEQMPGTIRFATTVVHGASANQIVLVGGGDVTLSSTGTSPDPDFQPTSLQALVDQTAAALRAEGRTSVSVGYDDSAFTGPASAASWSSSYTDGDIAPVHALEVDEGRVQPQQTYSARAANPALAAAQLFAQRLAADGITVTGPMAAAAAPTSQTASGTSNASAAPSAAGQETASATDKPLAQVLSPTLDQLIEHMLTVSDDDVAEALGHLTARAAGRPASFAGAVTATAAALQRLGVGPDEAQLYDNSGLSHQDRITPAGLAALLTKVAGPGRPELKEIVGGLPIAGFTGTLGPRFTGAASAGVGFVRAKTGTLTGVNTEAGLVEDADGRLLAFAVMATDTASAEDQLDRFAATLAGCGCR